MFICENIEKHISDAKELLANKHDIDCAEKVVKELCNICDNKRDLRNSNDLCKAISAARADSKSSTFQAETYKGFMIKMPKQNQWKNTS